jgi:hypothetical protein
MRKGNLIDLAIVLMVVLVAMVAYRVLSAPERQAPPYAMASSTVELRVGFRVEQGLGGAYKKFVDEEVVARDPRTGDEQARILIYDPKPGWDLVVAKLRATVDASGRYYYQDRRVMPGQVLRIESEVWVLEAPVLFLQDFDAPSGAS